MRSRSPISMFVAGCKPDGSFESVQCHSKTGYCWCVNKQGNELTGTRQWGKPNCTNIGKVNIALGYQQTRTLIGSYFLALRQSREVAQNKW